MSLPNEVLRKAIGITNLTNGTSITIYWNKSNNKIQFYDSHSTANEDEYGVNLEIARFYKELESTIDLSCSDFENAKAVCIDQLIPMLDNFYPIQSAKIVIEDIQNSHMIKVSHKQCPYCDEISAYRGNGIIPVGELELHVCEFCSKAFVIDSEKSERIELLEYISRT
jgi:uncharacterized Zn-finger protein